MESANGENVVAENAPDLECSNKVEEEGDSSTTEVNQPTEDVNGSKKQTKGSSSRTKNNKLVKNSPYVGTFGRTPRPTSLSQSLSFPAKLRESTSGSGSASVNKRTSSGLKPIKTAVLVKDDDAASSTGSPNAPSSGRRRNSTSSFSHRLDERPEIKETHDEEIKKFRKSLSFKATKMPSFYKEPLPKPQLKKIPNTRPVSPKFKSRRNESLSEKMERLEISGSPQAAKDQTILSPGYRDNNTAAFKKPNGKTSLTKMSEVKTRKSKSKKVLKGEDDKEDKTSTEQVRGSQVPNVGQDAVEACLQVNEVN